MKLRFLILSLLTATASAQVEPGRFIVELEGEPLAGTMALSMRTPRREGFGAVPAHRALLQQQQLRARRAIENAGAQVYDELRVTANALFVEAPDAERLASLPGVKRVYPVYWRKAQMEHALALSHVQEAWVRLGGGDRAGLGAKIAILDTGVDQLHPSYQDPSLPMPDGFPRANRAADLAYTNNKVIVARGYSYLRAGAPDSTPGGSYNGHGTGTSTAAGGAWHSAFYGMVGGAAPRAYIGNYKVLFVDAGASSASGPDDMILKAIEDAVADGMDVINMSLGESTFLLRVDDDIYSAVVQRAANLGVILVHSAGNDGPNRTTLSGPSVGPLGIVVGNALGDQYFAGTFTFGGSSYDAIPGDGPNSPTPITGKVLDVSKYDATGLVCNPLPGASLSGFIALIQRGTCNFSVKIANAAGAGAIAALLYSDDREPIAMATYGEKLPAALMSRSSGLAVKQKLASNADLNGTLDFTLAPKPADPRGISGSSSRGPGPENEILPDLVAVGTNVYTAAPGGAYQAASGTSFSAPIVAGAAATLKTARPGFSVDVYRSLLINTATPFALPDGSIAPVQVAGAGMLNLDAALQSNLVALPTSLSFGAGNGTVDMSRNLSFTNIGSSAGTWDLSVEPFGNLTAPVVSPATLILAPGASTRISVRFAGNSLAPAEYQGFIRAQGPNGAPAIRVPYWYAVSTVKPDVFWIPTFTASGRAGQILFWAITTRVTDQFGVRMSSMRPQASVVSGGGKIIGTDSRDAVYPGLWGIHVQLGPTAGDNVFKIEVEGAAPIEITIKGT
jgi:minor extracellular serine protease Vpr